MQIDQLNLTNFRNYASLDLTLHPGLTLITGENAQGKTNLLEAIFLLSLAKSHRTNRDQELIRWGADFAKVAGQITSKNQTFPLEIRLSAKGKVARYNHLDQAKLSQFIGRLNVILFAPEDMQFIKGSPQLRRRFLDSELGQIHPVYLQTLLDYHRLLKQRNTYLKQGRDQQQLDPLYLEILTDQLIDQAVTIIKYRLAFIQKLQSISQSLHHQLSDQRDHLEIVYKASSSRLDYQADQTIKDQLEALFAQSKSRELDQGVTLYGPHRDDLLFYLNENLAAHYASQGQQRTIILSLKLAELELMKDLTGDYPILLLDDVLSELDSKRQLILMNQIENKVQTILTSATLDQVQIKDLDHAELLWVQQGTVSKGAIK